MLEAGRKGSFQAFRARNRSRIRFLCSFPADVRAYLPSPPRRWSGSDLIVRTTVIDGRSRSRRNNYTNVIAQIKLKQLPDYPGDYRPLRGESSCRWPSFSSRNASVSWSRRRKSVEKTRTNDEWNPNKFKKSWNKNNLRHNKIQWIKLNFITQRGPCED